MQLCRHVCNCSWSWYGQTMILHIEYHFNSSTKVCLVWLWIRTSTLDTGMWTLNIIMWILDTIMWTLDIGHRHIARPPGPLYKMLCNQSITFQMYKRHQTLAVFVNNNIIKEIGNIIYERRTMRSCNAVSRWKMQPQQYTILNAILMN